MKVKKFNYKIHMTKVSKYMPRSPSLSINIFGYYC